MLERVEAEVRPVGRAVITEDAEHAAVFVWARIGTFTRVGNVGGKVVRLSAGRPTFMQSSAATGGEHQVPRFGP